jgi:uncharacterized RDD family membrane protein YckC
MQITPSVAVDVTMMVPWYKRLLNMVIDFGVLFLIIIFIGIIAGFLNAFGYPAFLDWISEIDGITDRVFTSGIMVLYLFGMESGTQRTVGKFLTGTMVVMEDGSKPQPGAIIKRAFCRIFLIEVLSFIREIPRGWHDTASDTYVVDTKKYKAACQFQSSFAEIGAPEIQ